MGDDKRQSSSAALVVSTACMLFTLVTCSFVLAQYYRWQGELTDLREQIVKALPACSPSSRTDVSTAQEATNGAAIDESLRRVPESNAKDLKLQSNVFSASSSSRSRLRRSAETNREGTGGRKQRRPDNKRNEPRQAASAIHLSPRQPTNEKRSRNQRAIQFRLDGDRYKGLSVNDKVSILRWWNPEDWCDGQRSDFFEFNKTTGHLRILQDGLYYVYAQITYMNSAAMNSFNVKINNETTLMRCTQERRFPNGSNASEAVDNCHAASVTRLLDGQTLSIWNNVTYFRRMDDSSATTFWGVMRISH